VTLIGTLKTENVRAEHYDEILHLSWQSPQVVFHPQPASFPNPSLRSRCVSMFVNAPSVESRAEWFFMIMGYLKVKSLALWLQLHPESSYEQFESVWPFLLDQMMSNATRVAIEQLSAVCLACLN
jgi:hypothetical protein